MLRLAILAALLATPAFADEFGELNPDEMSLDRMAENIRRGQTSMTSCAADYLMTKSGQHGIARETFGGCAEAGYTQAMTWMSYLDDNGFGGDYNPDASADWDRKAAEAGDPIGMFNHGLNLMRGHGVSPDQATGRAYIDRAAEAGVEPARRLQASNYDLDEVTPDADNWKYAPLF